MESCYLYRIKESYYYSDHKSTHAYIAITFFTFESGQQIIMLVNELAYTNVSWNVENMGIEQKRFIAVFPFNVKKGTR